MGHRTRIEFGMYETDQHESQIDITRYPIFDGGRVETLLFNNIKKTKKEAGLPIWTPCRPLLQYSFFVDDHLPALIKQKSWHTKNFQR